MFRNISFVPTQTAVNILKEWRFGKIPIYRHLIYGGIRWKTTSVLQLINPPLSTTWILKPGNLTLLDATGITMLPMPYPGSYIVPLGQLGELIIFLYNSNKKMLASSPRCDPPNIRLRTTGYLDFVPWTCMKTHHYWFRRHTERSLYP